MFELLACDAENVMIMYSVTRQKHAVTSELQVTEPWERLNVTSKCNGEYGIYERPKIKLPDGTFGVMEFRGLGSKDTPCESTTWVYKMTAQPTGNMSRTWCDCLVIARTFPCVVTFKTHGDALQLENNAIRIMFALQHSGQEHSLSVDVQPTSTLRILLDRMLAAVNCPEQMLCKLVIRDYEIARRKYNTLVRNKIDIKNHEINVLTPVFEPVHNVSEHEQSTVASSSSSRRQRSRSPSDYFM